MNERIRELAKEADPHNWHKRWYSGINPRVMDPEIKKFVELIVRECMKLNHDILCEDDPNYLDQVYKEHFGVEE